MCAATPGSAAAPVPIEEHRKRVADLIDLLPVVRLPLAECLGLVLAEDLISPIPLPPFDNSAMDGYAVRSADLGGAAPARPVILPVTDDIPAGRTELRPLTAGTAHRIMTGAPIPPGADSVVPVEQTDAGTTTVRLFSEALVGAHVRRVGEDVVPGATVLIAGTELGPAQLGLAAASGAADLPVRRRPRVLVLSTGSELVAPGTPLLPGQVYESNAIMLASAVREVGGIATTVAFVPDDVDAFHAALAPELDGTDLVITSGGVSSGSYEVVKDALSGQGVRFVRVAMQPGGPQGAGRYRNVAVVTLPGNPVSAAVSFEVFVRPALRAAMGHRVIERPTVTGTLTDELSAPAGRRQYRRARYEQATGRVSVVGGAGSHLIRSLAEANSLVVVPERATLLRVGAKVQVLLLGRQS